MRIKLGVMILSLLSVALSEASEPQPLVHLLALNQTLKAQVLPAEQEIAVQFSLGQGWKVNRDAPSQFLFFEKTSESKNSQFKFLKKFGSKEILEQTFRLPPLNVAREYRLQGTLYFCKADSAAVCSMESFDIRVIPEVREKNRKSQALFVIPLIRGSQ